MSDQTTTLTDAALTGSATAAPTQRFIHPQFASDLLASWRDEAVLPSAMVMLDGQTCDKDKPQKARNYSWVVAENWARAATKTHVAELRATCLDPPCFPIAICIRDGLGKTQQLHRTPVVTDWPMQINFEGQIAVFGREQLVGRLELCRAIVRIMGKGKTAAVVFTDHPAHIWGWRIGDEILREWMAVRNEPLTRLAWFLCEGKKELENDSTD